jgi:hypothetical protein
MGIRVKVDRDVAIMLKLDDDLKGGTVSISNPTQGMSQVDIKIT